MDDATRAEVELLEQDVIWRTPDGRVHYVGELGDDQLGDALARLNRDVERLVEHRRNYDDPTNTYLDGDLAREPRDWLHARPLYRALLAAQRRRSSTRQ